VQQRRRTLEERLPHACSTSTSTSTSKGAGGTEEGLHRQQPQQVEEGGEEGVGEEAWEDGVAGVQFFGGSEDGGWKQVTAY
jgi:hypothetical protein